MKWSIFFKGALTKFQSTQGVWKSSSTTITKSDNERRQCFLGKHAAQHQHVSVETQRYRNFQDEIFLEQLQGQFHERRGGYNDDSENEADTRRSGQQITQKLLHTLVTEINMRTRFGEVVTAVRINFAWFGPSLPHSTLCAVLDFFNVSEEWMNFFRFVLEAPMKFMEDGKDAPVQIRKRGTPISGPLSDMLGEAVLFCLDFAFNQGTDGARMYRLHDGIWFWGAEKTCVKGWAIMTEFAELMGLNFNEEKTGSVNITRRAGYKGSTLSSSLPKGDVRWGFLKLDSETGRFLID